MATPLMQLSSRLARLHKLPASPLDARMALWQACAQVCNPLATQSATPPPLFTLPLFHVGHFGAI